MYKITVILDLWSKLQDGLHQIFEKLPSKEAKKCLKLFLLEISIIHIFSQIFYIYKIYVFHIYKSMMNEWLDFGVQTIFTHSPSIFWRIIVYVFINYLQTNDIIE